MPPVHSVLNEPQASDDEAEEGERMKDFRHFQKRMSCLHLCQ